MFLKDEFAVNRLRMMRLRFSLMIAAMTFLASLVAGVGFASLAFAGARVDAPVHFNVAAATDKVRETNPINLPVATRPHTEKIMHGLTLLLIAFTGTGLLALYRHPAPNHPAGGGNHVD